MVAIRILGIDPGYGRLGFGVIEKRGSQLTCLEVGVVETAKGELPGRLLEIRHRVRELIEQHQPTALATEKLLFTKNQTTGIAVACSLGVVLAVGAEHGLSWAEYSPPQVKLAVTGVGRAEKHQVQFMVAKLLGLAAVPKPDDAADALAIAITHALASGPATYA